MIEPSSAGSWPPVVQQWRDVADREGRGPLRGPATPEALLDAEARLGIAMPAALRQLYLVADGLPTLGGDVFGIRSCSELAWFRDVEGGLIEVWDEINQDGGYLTDYLSLMRAGLAVSKEGDEYRLLIVQHGTGPDQWQLYEQSNGGDGVVPYASLAERLSDMVTAYFPS